MPLGFIPTDWYPSALAVHGDDLLIATAKGEGTRAKQGHGQDGVRDEAQRTSLHPHIAARIHCPPEHPCHLKNLPQLDGQGGTRQPVPRRSGTITFAGGKNPIKHVIYIIKENRTFDQILGDLKVGDGDPSLTMYGEDITPNEHKLALQFGVLDNFYDSGEVSGDGHVWSTAAITSDYNEKTWQIAYRGKERTYDFQGQVADEFPLDHNQPDIDDPSHRISLGQSRPQSRELPRSMASS